MSVRFSSLLKTNLWRVHLALESVLRAFSIYIVPLGIGLVSLAALALWDNHYLASGDKPLQLRVLSQSGNTLSPEEAKALLTRQPVINHYDTKLSEAPVWFSFVTPEFAGAPHIVEFPSRHALDVACWDSSTLQLLGRSSRKQLHGAIVQVKAGFALKLEHTEKAEVLCRATFAGPARLTAVLWPAEKLDVSIQEYHRKSGLLDGGLIVLAVFVLMTALVHRQSLYVLFAAWLFLNLRVGALSAGWDIQWLGQNVPQDWVLLSRTVTIALYALLTLTLYQTLFRDSLNQSRYAIPLRIVQWLCLPLLLGAIFMPFKDFLPVMWLFTGAGLLLMTLSLGSITYKSPRRVALWYGASLGVTFVSSLSEVIAAALNMKELVGVANSITAALASSLLTALAIAEQMRLEHKQRLEAQAELEHTYEAMPIGLFTLDMRGRFLSANPALRAMLGDNVTMQERDSWEQYFDSGSWNQLHQLVHAQTEGELEIDSKEVPGAGRKRFLVRATLARGKIEGSLQDVTEKSKAIEELRFMANHDPLTKVFNRRGIEKVLDSALEQLAQGKPLTLAYLDLDRFKLINDLYGHAVGDEVLKQVCERVSSMLTGTQKIGRVGGDEFVVVLPDTSIPLASWICRGIVGSIGTAPYRIGDKAFQVRGSIGLIEVLPDMQIKDAMSAADRACREAKKGHSNGLEVYEKNSTAFREQEAELHLAGRLSKGPTPEGLFLEMQPIMSLKAPFESLNFEVLLRMRDHDGKVIPASRLIPAAENTGRIGVIDRWVLSTTLNWLGTHRESLKRTQFVCMNLSGASLNDERFVQDAFAMLAQNPEAASRLCVEITESVALHDLEYTRRFIDKVRSYGVKVALDDFGAGYTSFTYLKELPADVLKIDGSFVVNVNAHPVNVSIVEAIVNLATNLGMKTIAEWAEDKATVETLAEIGVDYVQGYAVARPQEASQLLSAPSSASFVEDEQLSRFIHSLQTSAKTMAQIDLLELRRFKDMH